MNIDNKVLLYVIIGAYVFFTFIMPNVDKKHKDIPTRIKERLDNISMDRALQPSDKLDLNMCSKQCCKFTQWPVPGDAMGGPIPKEKLDKFIGSNYSCNSGSGSGCLCVSKESLEPLINRGGNSGSSLCK
jgi:hypothetical protein